MPNTWTDNQKMFAEYVIGTVESNLDYAAVNLSDAITLGITQWWGYNAARLLEKLKAEQPANFDQLSDRIKTAVNDHPSSDTGFWPYFYCTNDDAQSWKDAAQADENHAVQDALFHSDMFDDGGTLDVLYNWGVTITNVKSAIFYMSAYHQRPQSCLNVIRNIGGNRSLEDILNAILSEPILGVYKNRYNQVYDLLSAWDGTSAPPDFGQSSDIVGKNPNTDGNLASSVGYLELINGQDMIIRGAMGTGNDLLCRYNGNYTWYPVRNATAPGYPSTGGGHPGDPADFPAMRKLWEDNASAWQYAQAAGRLNPPQSGYSDCSACVWWAANAATDNKYSWLGTSTYTMLTTCPEVFHSDSGAIDVSQLVPGDLILMNWNNGIQHVDWYWGDNVAWGAGSAPLPKLVTEDVANYYTGAVQWISVHRFLEGA